jgi:hypothetical protein
LTISPSTSPRGLVTRRIGELNGATASRSSEKPNTLPCFSITPTTVYGTPAMRSSRPDRVERREEVLGDLVADHHDGRAEPRLLLA